MDHADKMKQNMDILGPKGLKSISMGELLDSVDRNCPQEVRKVRLLEISVMWLHERLMTVDVSTEVALTREAVSWYNALEAASIDDDAIAEAINDWRLSQDTHDLDSARRLSFANQLHNLMAAKATPSRRDSKTADPEREYGNMHPDRLRLSQNGLPATELDDDEPGEIIETSSPQWEGSVRPRIDRQDQPPDLSFLTGSNRLVLGETTNGHINDEGLDSTAPSATRTPHIDYVCMRCKIPGHTRENCPTRFDPAFDRNDADNAYLSRARDGRWSRFGELSGGSRRSQSPSSHISSKRQKKRRRRDYELSNYLSDRSYRGRNSNTNHYREGSPSESVRRTSRYPPAGEHAKKKVRRVTSLGDSFVEIINNKDPKGAPLSQEDEYEDYVRATPLVEHAGSGLDNEEMIADIDETSVLEKIHNCADGVEDFDIALDEMIKTESGKTDLLLLVKDFELLPSHGPSIINLFKGATEIWVRPKTVRPRPCEYFDVPAEGQQRIREQGASAQLAGRAVAGEKGVEGHNRPKAVDAELGFAGNTHYLQALANDKDVAMTYPAIAAVTERPAFGDSFIMATSSLQLDDSFLEDDIGGTGDDLSDPGAAGPDTPGFSKPHTFGCIAVEGTEALPAAVQGGSAVQTVAEGNGSEIEQY